MKRLGRWAVAIVALGSAACAAPAGEEAESGGAAQSSSQPSTFLQQIDRCARAATEAFDQANATNEMIQAAAAEGDRYAKAVDASAASIDRMRAENGGMQLAPGNARAAEYIAAFRANKAKSSRTSVRKLCDVLDGASQNFGGTLQRVEIASCYANVDKRLAKLVAVHVAWPGNRPEREGMSTEQAVRAYAPRLVDAILENDSARDRVEVATEVAGVIEGSIASANELCMVLEDAGEMGGGTGAQQLYEGCRKHAYALLEKELASTFPEQR